MANKIVFLAILAIAMTCSLVIAFEPSPLQDFCIADPTSTGLFVSKSIRVNGLPYLDSKLAEADDFSFEGFNIPGNTSNPIGVKITPVNVAQIPGLNTLGISLARIDYAPGGVTPPHTHPRAAEILTVVKGKIYVGFVTSNPENKLISKVLKKGDVFVFPVGLVHFQQNLGSGTAISQSSLSNQNPGVITIANSVFGSNPSISEDVLAKAFQMDKYIISNLQANI